MSLRYRKYTAKQLIEIYNGYGPVRPLKTWKGRKADLIARIRVADKQSGIAGPLDTLETSCEEHRLGA